jgi:S-formylglutathione hydrolase FrmB
LSTEETAGAAVHEPTQPAVVSNPPARSANEGRRPAVTVLRLALAILLGVSLWNAAEAKAVGVEMLMVPSAAMGRDIPVAFSGGGPHMVVLLDAFNAGPDVSNWVSAGNAMNTLAGKGISVAAPAGGAYSMYTDWEQDGSKVFVTRASWPPTQRRRIRDSSDENGAILHG